MEVLNGPLWVKIDVLDGVPDEDNDISIGNSDDLLHYIGADCIEDYKTVKEVECNADIAAAADKWMAMFHPAGRPDSYTGGETSALIRAVQAKRDAMRPPTLEELIDAEIKQALATTKTDDVAKRILQLVKEHEKAV